MSIVYVLKMYTAVYLCSKMCEFMGYVAIHIFRANYCYTKPEKIHGTHNLLSFCTINPIQQPPNLLLRAYQVVG
jgi:hypothetical protein